MQRQINGPGCVAETLKVLVGRDTPGGVEGNFEYWLTAWGFEPAEGGHGW